MRVRGIRLRSLVTALLLLVLVLSARVRYTDSDARVTLLTAQALIETGRPVLNPYLPPEVLEREIRAPWSIWIVDGKMRNFYPPGASLAAVPAVAMARLVGLDMVRTHDDARLQILLAGILVAAIFLVFERTAALVLPQGMAYAASLVFVLGTSVTSTIGTALWGHGPVVLLGAILVWLLLAAEIRGDQPKGAVLGLLVGAAFWCRPTAAVPAILVLVFLSVRARREVIGFIGVAGTMVGMLVAVSFVEIGQFLPVYYHLSTWALNEHPLIGFVGVLVSPGRGLLTFSPLLLIGSVGWFSSRLRRDPLFLVSGAWAICQAALVARNADWWGGWCFGPRLLCDSLPAWFLMVMLSMVWLRSRLTSSIRLYVAVATMVSAALFSIGVHCIQGLFNNATYWWNGRPNVYDAPIEKLFDISHPQFFATWNRNDDSAAGYLGDQTVSEDEVSEEE